MRYLSFVVVFREKAQDCRCPSDHVTGVIKLERKARNFEVGKVKR